MDVSVVLCTRDRAGLLERTLAHLRRLRIPAGVEWEVVVVDNGSTDRTPDVLAAADGLPLRTLREETAGKAHAANLATREALGDLLLWIDDDVAVMPGWVEAYLDSAARHPEAAFFGGTVRPSFEAPPPDWLAAGLQEVALPFALIDLGPSERPFHAREKPNGGNMALRADTARRFPWNPARGPGQRLAGCESLVIDAMLREGLTGTWTPDAVVEHHVASATMNLDYIRLRYRRHGKTLMKERRSLAGAARSLLCAYGEAYPRYLVGRALGVAPGRWLRQYRRAHTHIGKLEGLFG